MNTMPTIITGTDTNPTAYIQQYEDTLNWSYGQNGPWTVINTTAYNWQVVFENNSPSSTFTVYFSNGINLPYTSTDSNTISPFKINSSNITLDGMDKPFNLSNSDYNNWFGMITTASNLYSINVQKFNMGYTDIGTYFCYLCDKNFCESSTGTITVSNCSSYQPSNIVQSGGLFGEYAFKLSSANITISECNNFGKIGLVSSSTYNNGQNCGGLFGQYAFSQTTGNILIKNCINKPLGVCNNIDCGGLFGPNAFSHNSGTIEISGCSNAGSMNFENCGGLVGFNSFNSCQTIKITGCSNTGMINNVNCGGLVGHNSFIDCQDISISNCQNAGDINFTNCGGLFGHSSFTNCPQINISNCKNTGIINSLNCGGLFGFVSFYGGQEIDIYGCSNTGSIKSTNCGGLFGSNSLSNCSGHITISNCQNTGSIQGSNSGGIFGNDQLVQCGSVNTIQRCVNTGAMSASGCGGIGCSFGNDTETNTLLIDNCVNSGTISDSSGGLVYKIYTGMTPVFQNSYSKGSISGTNNASIVVVTPSTTTINNCYIIDGTFTNSGIVPTYSYPVVGTWDTPTAISTLYIDLTNPIWAYDQDRTTEPFVLLSLNPTYTPVGYLVTNTLAFSPFTAVMGTTVTIKPDLINNTTTKITYMCDNTGIATVTSANLISDGMIITAISIGDANISITQLASTTVDSVNTSVKFTVLTANTLAFLPITAVIGETIRITPSTFSNNTTDPIIYTCDELATVTALDSGQGMRIEPNEAGKTTISIFQQASETIGEADFQVDLTVLSANTLAYDTGKPIINQPFQISPNTQNNLNSILYKSTAATFVPDSSPDGTLATFNVLGIQKVNVSQVDDTDTFVDGIEKDFYWTVYDQSNLAFTISNQLIQVPFELGPTSNPNNRQPISYTSDQDVTFVEKDDYTTTVTTNTTGSITIHISQPDDNENYVIGTNLSLTFNSLAINTLKYDVPLALNIDEQVKLISTEDNNKSQITYTSNNLTVATVDNTGGVTAKSNGTATIQATQLATEQVGPINKYIHITVETNTLKYDDIPTLNIDDKVTLTPTENNNKSQITYTSNNLTVATVDNTGGVTAKSNGTATIQASQPATYKVGAGNQYIDITVGTNTLMYDPIPDQFIDVQFTLSPQPGTKNNSNPISYTTLSSGVTLVQTDVTTVNVIPAVSGTIIIHATQAYDSSINIVGVDIPITVLVIGQLSYASVDDEHKLACVLGPNTSIQNLVIPSTTNIDGNEYTVVGIAEEAFFNKPETLSGTIEFPTTLTYIGASAFRNCALTGYLSLPHSVNSIGAYAFQDCGFGGMLVLPPSLTELKEYVFAECSFTSMAPPIQLTHIGARALYNLPLFVYDFTQCEQLSYIDPSAFDEYNQSFLDINVYVTRFTYDRLQIPQFPDYVKFHTGVPVSNICFIAGTRVQTDQGILAIETLSRKHTLNGQPITLTKTKHDDPYLVKIQAYAFTNSPTQDTYMSMNHRIYFNHDRVKARDLVNGDTVTLVDYHGEPLYNVLVKAHTSMLVHGMRVETLDPTSPIALVYTSRLPPIQRYTIIQKLNTQENYEDTVRYLKRMQ